MEYEPSPEDYEDVNQVNKAVKLSDLEKIIPQAYAKAWLISTSVSYTHLDVYKRQLQCNTVAQMVISSFLEKYNIDDHIDKIREVYHRRRDAAVDSIERFFPDNIKYTKPEGGLFLWVEPVSYTHLGGAI